MRRLLCESDLVLNICCESTVLTQPIQVSRANVSFPLFANKCERDVNCEEQKTKKPGWCSTIWILHSIKQFHFRFLFGAFLLIIGGSLTRPIVYVLLLSEKELAYPQIFVSVGMTQ